MNLKTTQIMLICAFVALIAFVGLSSVDAAPAAQIHYSQLSAAPAKTHDGVSSVDTSTVVSPLDDQYFATEGNPKVTVRATNTSSGATCVIACYRWFQATDGTWTFLGKTHSGTLTFDNAIEIEGGDAGEAAAEYGLLTDVEFDTRGATHYEIRLDTLSAGTADVWAWTYGAKSR